MNDVLLSKGLRELHLFAGAGGGILGGMLLGHTCVCAVEIDAYCRRVLLQRQRDGILPRFPIWDDVRTFDGKPWRGKVDVVCGGFPCQDISCGAQGAKGIKGERSGLWTEMARITGEVRPTHVLVENSPMLTSRGLGIVIGDLARMGYVARWGVVSAFDAGAAHRRKRIWIVADDAGKRLAADMFSPNRENACWNGRLREWWWLRESTGSRRAALDESRRNYKEATCWKETGSEPPMVGKADAMAHRVERLKAIGNGQVPAVVRLAWRILASDSVNPTKP